MSKSKNHGWLRRSVLGVAGASVLGVATWGARKTHLPTKVTGALSSAKTKLDGWRSGR
jgi:hypothetical protein